LKKILIGLALALALTLGLAACGGGSGKSDEGQIRDIIALGNKKDTAICDRLTDKWMKDVVGGDKSDCEKQVKQSPKNAIKTKTISVNGNKATVTAEIQDDPGEIFLVKDGGDWKLDDIQQDGSPSSGGSSSTETSTSGDRLRIKGTYDAFVAAANDEDETVFCGLMSDRYAAELIGQRGGSFPVAECVNRYKSFDFSRLQRAVRRVKPVEITVTGDTAQLKLSDGERVLFEKQKGRWVIDDIRT
jgi:hypothetical protein